MERTKEMVQSDSSHRGLEAWGPAMSNSSRLKEGSEVETLGYTEICTGVYLNMAHKNKTNKAAAWCGGRPVQLQDLGG